MMFKLFNKDPIKHKIIEIMMSDIDNIIEANTSRPGELLQTFYGIWYQVIDAIFNNEEISNTTLRHLTGLYQHICNDEFFAENYKAILKFKDFFRLEFGLSIEEHLEQNPHILL